jgi:hypothetical protein
MDEFTFLTDKDRQNISYGACVGGSVLLGLGVGRVAQLPGLLAGAATGLAIGLLTCKRLSPAIEHKLFSEHERLSEREILQVLRVVRDETGVQTKTDAMYLMSQIRRELALKGHNISKESRSCLPARIAAQQMLSRRT